MNIFIAIGITILLLEVTYLVIRSFITSRSNTGKSPLFVDTSALMDGRIVTAAQTGFIPSHLVVPESVIAELQLLADQADGEKRTRARRGLDAVKELQGIKGLTVTVLKDGPLNEGGVDARLVELAKRQNGKLCTIDFNLNKVAAVHDVPVLNINELAGSIRMAFLPGETIHLALSQKGQSNDQAVGYLADGTMVVVDKAAKYVGSSKQVEFIRSLQTAAGRMMFAKLVPGADGTDGAKSNTASKSGSGRKAVTAVRKAPMKKPAASRKLTGRDKEASLIELVNNQE